MYNRFGNLNPYEIHKQLVNEYILRKPGDSALLKRDESRDKNDNDIIRENHRFLWDDNADGIDNSNSVTWEQRLAKKYYDKLFKEYCICDLARYKDNKVALRWRIENEVIIGKGQFICGSKHCLERDNLRSWEVNFAYAEHDQKKNALIKLRLCPDCSAKLNYHSKKREVKKMKKLDKMKRKSIKSRKYTSDAEVVESTSEGVNMLNHDSDNETNQLGECTNINKDDINNPKQQEKNMNKQLENEKDCWSKKSTDLEEKSREEEFDEYLEDLLL